MCPISNYLHSPLLLTPHDKLQDPATVLALLTAIEQELSNRLSRAVDNVLNDEEPPETSSDSYQQRVDAKACIIQGCPEISARHCMCHAHSYETEKKSSNEMLAKIKSVSKSITRMNLQSKHVNAGDSQVMRVYSVVNDEDIEDMDFLGEDEDGFVVHPEDDEETESILAPLAKHCNLRTPTVLISKLIDEFDFRVHEDSQDLLEWNGKLPMGWNGKTGIKLIRSSSFRKGVRPDTGQSTSRLQYRAETRANPKSKTPKVIAPRICYSNGCTNPVYIQGLCTTHQPECEFPGCSSLRNNKSSGMCRTHHNRENWTCSFPGCTSTGRLGLDRLCRTHQLECAVPGCTAKRTHKGSGKCDTHKWD